MRKIVLLTLLIVVGLSPVVWADIIAYWRFDDVGDADIEQWGPVGAGNGMPDSDGQSVWRKAANDYSGNGNHLTTWEYDDVWGGGVGWAGMNGSADVPYSAVPQTGASNTLSMQNAGGWPCAMTWSEQSNPVGTNIETITPGAFTIEASFKADSLSGYHTIVGRDDRYVAGINGDLASLYFQVMPSKEVAFKYSDVDGVWHEIISAPGTVTTGQWYNMVGVSDGQTMSLYLDNVLIGQVDLTQSGSANTAMALGNASGGDWQSGTWSLGRGLYAGGHVDRWFGLIDEVRISNEALDPSQFLSAPEPCTIVLLGVGSLTLIRRRRN